MSPQGEPGWSKMDCFAMHNGNSAILDHPVRIPSDTSTPPFQGGDKTVFNFSKPI